MADKIFTTVEKYDPKNDTHKNFQEGIYNLITQSDMSIFASFRGA